jgi:translation elongation factor EF-G
MNLVDKPVRRRWIEEVEARVATGLGSHRPDKAGKTSTTLTMDCIHHGAKPLGVNPDLCERVNLPVPEEFAGTVIEKLGKRKGEMLDMTVHNKVTTLIYNVPTRGLLGYRAEFIMDTKGEGILHHSFAKYERHKGEISSWISEELSRLECHK